MVVPRLELEVCEEGGEVHCGDWRGKSNVEIVQSQRKIGMTVLLGRWVGPTSWSKGIPRERSVSEK